MNKELRLRRCLLLCCHFARNLAYHRARRMVDLPPAADFWISADGNFIDIAVLEWCKILGDDKAEQGWRKIVVEPDRFHAELLVELGMEVDEWDALVQHIRLYRDKFLAHLDSDLHMNIPKLDQALRAAEFYYRWILEYEFGEFDRTVISPTLMSFYAERLAEAKSVYKAVSVRS
ncbi:MAG: hypothetical protein KGJ57_17000 [Sphingomonadales bacterium]|nr:hypothetical protein [Sphingomonadales bacterium]MDE2171098.1 hypothetical protein [Sphingomonadales bacterium]